MLQSLLSFDRRLTFSRTTGLVTSGLSRPRGPGFHVGTGGVAFLIGTPPFFDSVGDATGGGGAVTIEVTPAHVAGGALGTRSTSFSGRNSLLNFKICRPVAASSRTVGHPSIIVIRRLSSGVTTSSTKGA